VCRCVYTCMWLYVCSHVCTCTPHDAWAKVYLYTHVYSVRGIYVYFICMFLQFTFTFVFVCVVISLSLALSLALYLAFSLLLPRSRSLSPPPLPLPLSIARRTRHLRSLMLRESGMLTARSGAREYFHVYMCMSRCII